MGEGGVDDMVDCRDVGEDGDGLRCIRKGCWLLCMMVGRYEAAVEELDLLVVVQP